MKLAVMQPYFLPYIGYFQMINAVDKFVFYDDKNHFVFGVVVTANRTNGYCYGQIAMYIMKQSAENNVNAKFIVGEYGSIFTGYDNVNQMTLELVGDFMKEVEDPNW